MHIRRLCSNIFDTKTHFGPNFWPYEGRAFLPCICFPQRYVQRHLWSCAISAEWRFKHFMNISCTIPFHYLKTVFTIQYSTLSLSRSQVIFLKCDGSIWDLGGKFRQKWIHMFWAFWSLSFKFFFKRGNHEEYP